MITVRNPKGWNRVEPKEKPKKEKHTVEEGLKPLDNFDLGGSE